MRIITVTTLMTITIFMSSFQTFAQEKEQQKDDTTTYIKIWVDGLACPFCAYGLEKKLKKIEGSKDIFIEINEGYVTFNVLTSNSPSKEALLKLVKEAGFKARDISFATKPFTYTDDAN